MTATSLAIEGLSSRRSAHVRVTNRDRLNRGSLNSRSWRSRVNSRERTKRAEIHAKCIDRLEQIVGRGKSDRTVKGLARLKFAIMITPDIFMCIEDFAQIPFCVERHGIM